MSQFTSFEELVKAGNPGPPKPRSKPLRVECEKMCYPSQRAADKQVGWHRAAGKWRKGRSYYCQEHKAWHISKG
jgi:hypothetical protein